MSLPFASPLSYLGALTASYIIFKTCSFLHLFFLHRSHLQKYLRRFDPSKLDGISAKRSDNATASSSSTTHHSDAPPPKNQQSQLFISWALVSGATDGIGLGFAQELAHRGFNLILHGRDLRKLGSVEASILAANPQIQTRLLHIDSANYTEISLQSALAPLVSEENLPITVLINNVGGTAGVLTHSDFLPLASHTFDEISDVISVNATFATHLTRALLPILTKHQPSLIMNLGSATAIGFPYLSVYSGTKAYVTTLAAALSTELAAEGLDIEVLSIIITCAHSAGNSGYKPSLAVPSSRGMAEHALDRVGCGSAVVPGYWVHALQAGFMSRLPESVWRKMITAMLRPMKMKRATEGVGGY